MHQKQKRKERLSDNLIPFFWNRWFQIGTVTLIGGGMLMLAPSTLVRASGLHVDASLGGTCWWIGSAIAAAGFVLLGLTGFGTETVKSYRTTCRRIDENQQATKEGHVAKPNAWEQEEYNKKAHTYCAKIGVKAAAYKHGFANDLPDYYKHADWTEYELRNLPRLAWVLLCCATTGSALLSFGTSPFWQVLGGIVIVASMLLLETARRLRLWAA